MSNKAQAPNRIFTPSFWAKNPTIKKAQIAVALLTIAAVGLIMASFIAPGAIFFAAAVISIIHSSLIAKVALIGSAIIIGSVIFKMLKKHDNYLNSNSLTLQRANQKGLFLSESEWKKETKIFQTALDKSLRINQRLYEITSQEYCLQTALENTKDDPNFDQKFSTTMNQEHSTFKSILDTEGNKLLIPCKKDGESEEHYINSCLAYEKRLFPNPTDQEKNALKIIRTCLMQKTAPIYSALSSEYALLETPINYTRRLDFSDKTIEISIDKNINGNIKSVHLKFSSTCSGALQGVLIGPSGTVYHTPKIKLPDSYKVETECDIILDPNHPEKLEIAKYKIKMEKKDPSDELAFQATVDTAYKGLTKEHMAMAENIKNDLQDTITHLITLPDSKECCNRFFDDIDELPLFTIKDEEKRIKFTPLSTGQDEITDEVKKAYAKSCVVRIEDEFNLSQDNCKLLQVLLSQNAFRTLGQRFSEELLASLPPQLQDSHNLSEPKKSVIITIKREKSKIVFHLESTLKYPGGGKMELNTLRENYIDPFKLTMNCDVSLDGENVKVENIDLFKS
ncbi:MAG: hypothetical protein HZB76_04470 [Chlamydiae bacterium]|nr:hypothetical protein [Chlamydiota bacterium]